MCFYFTSQRVQSMDQKKLQGPWRTKVLYHRLMLPNWLRSCNKVEWNSPKEGVDLNLVILPDSSDWEKIIRVPFIPKGRAGPRRGHHSQNDSNRLSEPQKPRDSMRCMISDGDYPIGMQLLDPNHDYTTGPYKPVEGESQKRKLKVDTSDVYSNVLVSTTLQKNPDQFELTFKPSETFGRRTVP